MYEEEILENDQLDKAIRIVELIIRNTDDDKLLDIAKRLLDLLKLARKQGAVVGFYF